MNIQPIQYSKLNSRQKEIYNFQKLASVMADYGYNCIKLADDWQGADFLAYHIDGISTLRVQLKSRLTIDAKYQDKDLCMAFPYKDSWYVVKHDDLVSLVSEHTNWLNTVSWSEKGIYNSNAPNQDLIKSLEKHRLN